MKSLKLKLRKLFHLLGCQKRYYSGIKINFFFFGDTVQHVGSYFPTKEQTCDLFGGSIVLTTGLPRKSQE